MNTVCKILHISADAYEQMVLDHYFKWCMSHKRRDTDYQKLIANSSLFRWFLMEYRKQEDQFLEYYKPYRHTLEVKEAMTLYDNTIIYVYSRFNRPLINNALRT